MPSTLLKQFGVATAQVIQHVNAIAQSLSLRQQKFRVSLAEAAALNDAQIGLCRMDVGGAPFHTQKEGLEGMLSAMVSNDFKGGEDVLFIDRDPTWFPLVLHFLRTGVPLLPENTGGLASMFREAQYYSLEGLCRAAQPSIIVIGIGGIDSTHHCETYNALQQLWECHVTGFLSNRFSFCAGDGCLFAFEACTLKGYVPGRPGSVSKFCPAVGSWQRIANNNPISSSRGVTWIYHSDHIYGACGDILQSFNVSTGQWEALPPLTPRSHPTPCVVDGRLFVIGGSTVMEEYIASERSWVPVAYMRSAADGMAAVVMNGKLIVIGGFDFGRYLTTVRAYDPRDRTWNELPSLLTARAYCAATVLGGDIVVIGGWGVSGPMGADRISSVERYNQRLQCWEAMPSLTKSLSDSAAIVVPYRPHWLIGGTTPSPPIAPFQC